jgi:hypothetical protein
MADYTPLIARAVEGLDHNTGENRRELYDRARKALSAQLRGIEPPLEEAEITRERLALEEAIRTVEADAVRRHREDEVEQPPVAPPSRSLTDHALAGFRETVAEAEGLGEAAAQANKSARSIYPADGEQRHAQQPSTPDESAAPTETEAVAPEPPAQDGAPEGNTGWQAPPLSGGPEDEVYAGPRRSYRGLVTALIVLILLGGIAGTAYWQRAHLVGVANKVMAMVAAMRTSPPPAPPRETAPAQPKITDRIGQPEKPASSRPANAPAADVAQKVVLYEEDPANPQGKRFVGSAIWRTETVSPGPGLAPELAVRCDVEIPERHMRMTWSLRRNTDKALPASHTIEIMFTLPADFSEGGIQNVPGVLMKQNEQARGVPLAGLAVKVTNGFFLIGLNSVEADLARNIALLKERPWFDIPIVYNNNKRALLAVEKGTPGERAFEDAFRAWGQ